MNTELISLSKIFTENLFRIPDYQRGYSWTTRQLKDFWVDLELLDKNQNHYTGVLTLEEVDEANFLKWHDDLWILQSKNYTPYYVVDGQQRLTTSLILIQAIIERINDGAKLNYTSQNDIRRKYIFESKDEGISRSYVFGYEKDNPSYEFLKTRIFLEKSDNHDIGEQTIYTHNLLAAKKFFAERLETMTLNQLEDIFTKLTQRFLFNIYTISGNIDVFVAFETMNNRGKPLSHLELLKNRLIFLSTRLEADADERAKVRKVVNEAWKTAYHYLGKNEHNPLNDDKFLENQFILYVGPSLIADSKSDKETPTQVKLYGMLHDAKYKTYLLDEVFTSKNIAKTNESSFVTSEDSEESPSSNAPLTSQEIYNYAHHIKDTVQIYYSLLNPNDSNYNEDQKIALVRLNRLGWHDALPLALAIASKSKANQFTELLNSLERHIFLRTLAATAYYRYEPMNLYEAAIRFKTGAINLREVISDIDKKTESMLPNIGVAEALPSIYQRGYYAWKTIRFFLFEYEQELKRRARAKRDKLTWEQFTSESYEADYVTVEHIYPQRPKADDWRKHFSQFHAKERTALRNSLGNLVALSQPKNAALGNRSFAEKKKGTEGTSGYHAGSYSEIEISQYEEWTPKEILERGLKMWAFMEKRWRFKLKDDKARIKALGLTFLDKTPG